jgi:hypothetical protein
VPAEIVAVGNAEALREFPIRNKTTSLIFHGYGEGLTPVSNTLDVEGRNV